MDSFVVGTGRCGSTLLSRMLAQHPGVLSLSEFFTGLDMARCFAPQLSGEELSGLVSAEQPFVTAVLRRGHQVDEVTYPFEGATARYAVSDAVPWLLVSTLPPLSEDPDALFDEAMEWVRVQPPRPTGEQYRALFAWLVHRLGKSRWIERSGSALDYVGALAAHFPDARFVHIHRDGPEVALSMREHPAYRLNVVLRYDVPLGDGRRPSELGAFDLRGAPSDDDAVTRMLNARPDLVVFGRFWHDLMQRGLDAMESIPDERVHRVRFEELAAHPRAVLVRLADLFELERGDWIDRATALVHGVPPRRLPALPPDQAEALEEVCRQGGERLAASRTG